MMVYITVKQPPMYRQMSLDEFLFQKDIKPLMINSNLTNTHTYAMEFVGTNFLHRINVHSLINTLEKFNESTRELHNKPRKSLYREFYIPKRSGGLRKIDAPEPALKDALRELKRIFEQDFNALYHTATFSYVGGRNTVDAVKRHQSNESKWFAKFDLSNFFGNTTLEFVFKMFSTIFPFSEVVRYERGASALRTALDLAFLDGGLPQGTPLSPLITNIMMIPVDFTLSNGLREWNKQKFVYTRYADDFIVSSRYTFSFKEVEKYIVDVLRSFEAPFSINTKKTRYGSSAGSNWNLGVMLNKDNNITVGYKKKRQFQAMLASYVMDKMNGKSWSQHDVKIMDGHRNYYRMVEKENIDKIVEHIGNKFGVNIPELIAQDLRS